jgi:hypothetical protein
MRGISYFRATLAPQGCFAHENVFVILHHPWFCLLTLQESLAERKIS